MAFPRSYKHQTINLCYFTPSYRAKSRYDSTFVLGLRNKTPEIKLSWDSEFEGLIIVITCAEKDYRTGWAINKVLEIHLEQKEEMSRHLGKDTAEFSRFEYWDEEQQKLWRMLSNRSENGFLAPEYKKFDYILFAFGEFLPGKSEYFLEQLRSVRFITSAYTVPAQSIKTKELLLT